MNKLILTCLAATCFTGGAYAGEIVRHDGTPDRTALPNILFILVDDLGYSDLGYSGSEVYDTPNVDRLASEGMRFTDFYSAGAVCSPTRASIMTGKYPVRTGITTFLLDPERDAERMVSPHLDLSEVTIGEAFRQHGYVTGYFGKWHLGYSQEHWAGNQGFDVAVGGMDLPWAWQVAHPGVQAPDLDRENGHTRFFSPHHLTFMDDGPEGEYLTDRLTNETVAFIEANRDRPFFGFLSFHTVHTPLQPKKAALETARQRITKAGLPETDVQERGSRRFQNLPEYAAMVHHMDENVGRLMDVIERLGLSRKTIVVFTSDNGGVASLTSNRPLRGAKHLLDEGGIRVPTIVRWPNRIRPDSTSAVPLISNDFFPTLLDLAGLPLQPADHLDGISFGNVLTGKSEGTMREAIYWHNPHKRVKRAISVDDYKLILERVEGAIRVDDYKLILDYVSGTGRLYDLSNDIGEYIDLSEEKPELASTMKQMLLDWLQDTGARFPDGIDPVAGGASP